MTAFDGMTRFYSPAGDHREHPVRCQGRYACRTETWALSGICDACHAEVAGIDDTTAEELGITAPEVWT